MIALQLLPVVLSLLVLAAHFLRANNFLMVFLVLALLGVLAVRRTWAARTVQIALLLGAVEWVRTLIRLAGERSATGEPAVRMAVILGSVALLTGLSALVFRSARMRRRYRGPEG